MEGVLKAKLKAAKFIKVGGCVVVSIPKALFNTEVLDQNKRYIIEIREPSDTMGLLCSLFAQNFWKVGY